ncbi:MAG: mechanosensitive ion channel family protein [Acidimicrobiales bacterium]
MPRSDDYLDQLLRYLGIGGFAGRTVHFLLLHVAKVGLILLVALVVGRVGSHLVRRSLRGLAARSPLHGATPRAEQRAETLGGVIAGLTRAVVWVMATLLAIGELGFNLAPFLATASVVGVAVGFGAQSLVRDFLAGFFILVEDQYGVGDTVTVLDVTGIVEAINLRVTRMRGTDGTVWFVPNGEIRKVGNAAKEWSIALVDVPMTLETDLAAATSAISEEVASFASDQEWASSLLEAPEVLGVEAMAADSFTIRVSARTLPGARAAVARELRRRIGARLVADRSARVGEESQAGTEGG